MTNTLAKFARPKVPLEEAADLLQELTHRVDDGEELSSVLLSVFNETRLDLAEAVDRRIAFDAWIKHTVEAIKGIRKEYAAKLKRLEVIHEAFKEHTRRVIELHPKLPYRGRYGGHIRIQRNPPKAVPTFLHGRTITKDMIERFNIDESYVKVTYTLNIEKIKADLMAGKDVPNFRIDQDIGVRFKT